jgi:uncharacterized protein
MERFAYSEMLDWKNSENRKPLIVRGARQVGKTWLMKKFAEAEYEDSVYINFEDKKELQSLFEHDLDIARILVALQIESGIKPKPGKTLIIFDEIQEAERGLTSLKYFNENAPEYHVVAAGSYLGLSMQKEASFPVGKVQFLDLYPLNFSEFLLAMEERPLYELIKQQQWVLIKTFKTKYIELLKQYYYLGGMPEVVDNFINTQNYNQARNIQQNLLLAYQHDFSKYAPAKIAPRIRMVWESLPSQLSRENKKFVFGLIKTGARARDYELAIEWLKDSGLISKVYRVTKPGLPLSSYKDLGAFKVFVVDVGLLGAMANLNVKVLLRGDLVFEEFKGALTEQYVYQQLVSANTIDVYYWSAEKSSGEVDFLIQNEDIILPIEVKSSENLQSKSLKSFKQKYNSQLVIRTSMSNYRMEEWLENIPLYALDYLTKKGESS